MKAIVAGSDAHLPFIELTVRSYRELWPGCPLTFRVPVNDRRHPGVARLDDVELVDSPIPFRATLRALLQDLRGDEWVYWCTCDRYPTRVDAEALSRVLAAVERGEADGWNAVRLLRDRDQTTGEQVEVGGLPFSPKAGLRLGFWHHQFLRVRVLAANLLHPGLPEDAPVQDLTRRFAAIADGPHGSISALARTLVPDVSLLALGEPCREGRLTENGVRDLERRGCVVPDLPRTPEVRHFT